MNFFKRKCNKKDKIRFRFGSNGFFSKKEVTEQEYVDKHIQDMSERISLLSESIDLIKALVSVNHIIINPISGADIEDKYVTADEARKWAKDKGYTYIAPFKHFGELWVEEKNSAFKQIE